MRARASLHTLETTKATFLDDDLPRDEWNRRRSLQAMGRPDPNGGIDPNAPILRLHDGLAPAVWQKARAQQLGSPAPAGPTSPPTRGPRLGPQRLGVGPLLGLISRAEGTEADGYDTMYNNPGGRRSPSGWKKPTQMTVDEAIQGRADRVRLTGGSAIGRYQFLPGTLAQLKTWMGLQGNEVMTAELQDAMAEELLYHRGFDKYQAGDLTAEQFQRSLANEWSSLAADGGDYSGYDRHGGIVSARTPSQDLAPARVKTQEIQAALADALIGSKTLDPWIDGGDLPPP